MSWEWRAFSQAKLCGFRLVCVSGWIMVLSERYGLGANGVGSSCCVLSGRAFLPGRRIKSLSFIKQVENEAGRIALH